MRTSQERVFDVLDVATKPIQWLIGGIKFLLFGAFLVVVAIGTPIYMFCTGQSVTGDMVALAFIAILAVIAFFYTPYYFWLGGIATVLGIGMLLENHEAFVDTVVGRGLHFKLFVICWLLFGILRKFIWRRLSESPKPYHSAASTTRRGGGLGGVAREVGDARPEPACRSRLQTAQCCWVQKIVLYCDVDVDPTHGVPASDSSTCSSDCL